MPETNSTNSKSKDSKSKESTVISKLPVDLVAEGRGYSGKSKSLPTAMRGSATPGKLTRLSNDALQEKAAATRAHAQELNAEHNKLFVIGEHIEIGQLPKPKLLSKKEEEVSSEITADSTDDIFDETQDFSKAEEIEEEIEEEILYNTNNFDFDSDKDDDNIEVFIKLINKINDLTDQRTSIEKLLGMTLENPDISTHLINKYLAIFSDTFSIFKPSESTVGMRTVDILSENLYPEKDKPDLVEFWNAFGDPSYSENDPAKYYDSKILLGNLKKKYLQMMQAPALEDVLYHLEHYPVDSRMFCDFLKEGVYYKDDYVEHNMTNLDYAELIRAWISNPDNKRTMNHLADILSFSESEQDGYYSGNQKFMERLLMDKFRIRFDTIIEDENEVAAAAEFNDQQKAAKTIMRGGSGSLANLSPEKNR